MTNQSIPHPDTAEAEIEPFWQAQKKLDQTQERYARTRAKIGADIRFLLDIDRICERERLTLFTPIAHKKQAPILLPSSGSGYTTQPDSTTSLQLRGVPEVDSHAS